MKTNTAAILSALVLLAPAAVTSAQDADQPQPRPERRPRFEQRDDDGPGRPARPREGRPGDRVDRPRAQRHEGQGPDAQRPRPTLIAALDVNNDGEIDEKEIANATKALKKLDKNKDGKLTMEDQRPAQPQGGPREDSFRREGPDGPRPMARQEFRRDDRWPEGAPDFDGPRPPRPPHPPGDE
jgi:hypothetical protein